MSFDVKGWKCNKHLTVDRLLNVQICLVSSYIIYLSDKMFKWILKEILEIQQ